MIAIVTGASSGIGWHLARGLAAEGYTVIAAARRKDRLAKLAKEVKAAGGTLIPVESDLGRHRDRENLVKAARKIGPIDLLVNNAGYGLYGKFWELDQDKQLGMIHLNIEGLVHLTRLVLPDLVKRRTGGVINVASTQGFNPIPFFGVYNATKAFVLAFTENLAEELRGTGVRAMASCPGPVATEFVDVAQDAEVHGKLPELTAEEVAEDTIRAYKAGRVVRVVGFTNKIVTFLPRLMPRALVRWVYYMSVKPAK